MLRNLLLTGGPGPGHDFGATAPALADLLAEPDARRDGFATTVTSDPTEAVGLLRAAADGTSEPWDLCTVHALRWDMAQDWYAAERDEFAFHLRPGDGDAIAAFVAAGGGLLALHTAVICFDADPAWRALIGGSWRWGRSSHAPVGPVDITVTEAGRAHPITAGTDAFTLTDEVYADLDLTDASGARTPLLTGTHEGRTQPVLWTQVAGRGRVVTDLLGHGTPSLDHPEHHTILRRAATWAARRANGPKGA